MKKFTVNCNFGGQEAPFSIYIGDPESSHNPLHFQSEWLSNKRGGTIPAEVINAVSKLKTLADKNHVALEELCVYALGTVTDESTESSEIDNEDVLNNEETIEEHEVENIEKQEDDS